MAASATKYGEGIWVGGNGKRYEYGVITYDSDATVEVSTALSYLESFTFSEAVSGGSADLPSIDETSANGRVTVPATGAVTVDTGANSTRVFHYLFIGF
jgi:hypothetical protein